MKACSLRSFNTHRLSEHELAALKGDTALDLCAFKVDELKGCEVEKTVCPVLAEVASLLQVSEHQHSVGTQIVGLHVIERSLLV